MNADGPSRSEPPRTRIAVPAEAVGATAWGGVKTAEESMRAEPPPSRRDFLRLLGTTAGLALVPARSGAGADPRAPEAIALLSDQREELRRRVDVLPRELAAWVKESTTEIERMGNASQLKALSQLMDQFVQDQKGLLNGLDVSGNTDAFLAAAGRLTGEIVRAHRVWDYFREKFAQRLTPSFKAPLRLADAVAWDGYQSVIKIARDRDLPFVRGDELREPPLCYLAAASSPATTVRRSKLSDLIERLVDPRDTPIPFILIPWDHAASPWAFLSIHHEVGHDLEADLRLGVELRYQLEVALSQAKNSDIGRTQRWLDWQGEVFADLVALQLGGPAFAEMLVHQLLSPAEQVVEGAVNDAAHPTPYLRILMNTSYARTLLPKGTCEAQEVARQALRVESAWKAVYGAQPQWDPYVADFPDVFRALMDTPLKALGNRPVRGFMPFRPEHVRDICEAVDYLLSGQKGKEPRRIAPRHCVAAARLAVSSIDLRVRDVGDRLAAIGERTVTLVAHNTPQVPLGPGDAKGHERFIRGFARSL